MRDISSTQSPSRSRLSVSEADSTRGRPAAPKRLGERRESNITKLPELAALAPLNLISGLLHAVQLGQVPRHPIPYVVFEATTPHPKAGILLGVLIYGDIEIVVDRGLWAI